MPLKFLLPFLYSFVASLIAIWFLLRLKFLRSNLKNRFGGVVVIVVFVLTVLIDRDLVITRPIAGILAGGLLILFFGLWDDLKNLNWKWQLVFQIIVAVVTISFGVRSGFIGNPFGGAISLSNPAIYYFFYILYFLVFLNSLNWLDGTDGLAGGVTLASLGTIFFLSFKPEVNQPAVAILSAIAGGALLGFLVFNFNPAKILAGTSGAWFFGFILASLSIFAGAKIATVMMAALIPILDLARVVWERWRSNQSIFQKDRRHLHYLLLERGIGERKIFFLYFFASVLIGTLALNLNGIGKLVMMGIVGVTYIILIKKIIKISPPLLKGD
ncbi:MAG: MraY family glycosyltransferase [Candidatus Moranbacteria bacterium]|nr:MraY family glycosyltransferase [Candidatus Moranbacteria bacterium]